MYSGRFRQNLSVPRFGAVSSFLEYLMAGSLWTSRTNMLMYSELVDYSDISFHPFYEPE